MCSLPLTRVAALGLAVVLAAGAAAAPVSPGPDRPKAETPAEKVRKTLDQLIDLDVENQPLDLAVGQIREQAKLNVLIDRKVQKEADAAVTLQLDDVPLETAVRLLAEAAGLRPVRMGNVLYVTTKENARDLKSDPELTPSQPGGPYAQEMIFRAVG